MYDFRTGVNAYQPGADRSEREESERFKCFTIDELLARDKVNLAEALQLARAEREGRDADE